jgi:hypothetical protein
VTAEELAALEGRLDVARLVSIGVEGAVLETFEFPAPTVGVPGAKTPHPRI